MTVTEMFDVRDTMSNCKMAIKIRLHLLSALKGLPAFELFHSKIKSLFLAPFIPYLKIILAKFFWSKNHKPRRGLYFGRYAPGA